jgi:hypothetical protein
LNGTEYVIEGYIGQGMDCTKGMATISKTSWFHLIFSFNFDTILKVNIFFYILNTFF